jgi:dCMP deaminase
MERTELKLYTWMNVAKDIAGLSTCQFTQVGCVLLTEDFKIISSGYNGVIKNKPHCCDVVHEDRDAHGIFADKFEIHAEMNALLQVTEPNRLKRSICFSTIQPCYNCVKHLVAAGVTDFYFETEYWRINKEQYISTVREAFDHISMTKLSIHHNLDKMTKYITVDQWL